MLAPARDTFAGGDSPVAAGTGAASVRDEAIADVVFILRKVLWFICPAFQSRATLALAARGAVLREVRMLSQQL
jgi:hypothetical protein